MRYLDYKLAYRWDDIERIKQGEFPFPKTLTMFISETCNQNCPGCNSKSTHKKNAFMDFRVFKEIVNDFAWGGGKAISFEGGGEPMLHPLIDKFIYYLFPKSLKIGIITNGTIFKEEMLYCDWVRISVPNPNKILPQTQSTLNKLMNQTKITTIGVKFLRSKLCPYPEYFKVNVDYLQIKDLRNHPDSLVKNPKFSAPCKLTQLRAVVDYDGTFYPCPYFPIYKQKPIGQGIISEIWGKPQHIKALQKIKNCNLYDCPFLEVSIKKLEEMHLEFI